MKRWMVAALVLVVGLALASCSSWIQAVAVAAAVICVGAVIWLFASGRVDV